MLFPLAFRRGGQGVRLRALAPSPNRRRGNVINDLQVLAKAIKSPSPLGEGVGGEA